MQSKIVIHLADITNVRRNSEFFFQHLTKQVKQMHKDSVIIFVFLLFISFSFFLTTVMQGSILPVTIPPRAHPRGFAFFFLLGGIFPTPGHAERDNSLPPGLLIDHTKIRCFVFKIDFRTIAQPDVLTRT